MQVLKEDIKNRILNVAKQEFAKRGFIKTSMRDIAKGAGVG
ncbi:MAG: TetR/AcrR family transcriptional regulator, partial [Duncaniella sp.]|nr:TetR/AcrR family transcriptional regulator [Duncaniella sp.]